MVDNVFAPAAGGMLCGAITAIVMYVVLDIRRSSPSFVATYFVIAFCVQLFISSCFANASHPWLASLCGALMNTSVFINIMLRTAPTPHLR